jgi:hypothetical protein
MHQGRRNGTRRDHARPVELRLRAQEAIDETTRAGAKAYDRSRDLPGLIRIDPRTCGAQDIGDLEAIVARLERALRAERRKARSGHWTYDLNRHIALRQAHLAETARLVAMKREKMRKS